MICRYCLRFRRQRPAKLEYVTSPENLSFSQWTIHQISHFGEWLELDLIQWIVFTVPFLDAEEDGGLLFWRWDPWNGIMRADYRRLQKEGAIPPGYHELGLKRLFKRIWKRLRNGAQNALKILRGHGRGARG